MQSDLLEQQLTREERLALKNKRTGLTIFQISWIMVFVSLVVVNWQLRFSQLDWPPPGVDPAPVIPATLASLALIASVVLARRAVKNLLNGDEAAFIKGWPWAIGLGAVFTVIMLYEWLALPYTGIYSDVFRMMTGFHVIHALVVGALMVSVYRSARAGELQPVNYWYAEGTTSMWVFVLVAWILFYVVLYWV